jgi:lipoic acid synthetase
MGTPVRKPDWFRIRRLVVGPEASGVLDILSKNRLNTVCTSAGCPNKGTCFGEGTATFLLLGDTCTRSCAFCAITPGHPAPPDPTEPMRVAEAAAELGLRYVVLTSVTRDDLPDQGAGAFAATLRAVRSRLPDAKVEVLTPDFSGREDLLTTVLDARPDVFNHNLETVRSLTPAIRSGADYDRSLSLLYLSKRLASEIPTKSGLMLGLGENCEELAQAFLDLAAAGVERLTLGQYLQPSRQHRPVTRYYPPEEFDDLAREAREAGILSVLAGPLVRSSYHAGTMAPGVAASPSEGAP